MTDKRITLAVINNKLENLTSLTNEVNDHVKETNGKVAENVLLINTIRTKQEDCPAKNNYNTNEDKSNFNVKEIISTGLPILIAIIAVVISVT